jgi:hypothetical protein
MGNWILFLSFFLAGCGGGLGSPLPAQGPASAPASLASTDSTLPARPRETRYLAFQLFTSAADSASLPPAISDLSESVGSLVRAVGTVGDSERRLGFVIGPLSLQQTDQEVTAQIEAAFAVARAQHVAVGFHIDDSMFWARLSHLNRAENVEFLDWNGTLNTGRRLDWSASPLQIMPQLCFQSAGVRSVVEQRARLIAAAIARGRADLPEESLFLGVIVGWETQLGSDFRTGKPGGFHALQLRGLTPGSSPAQLDQARERTVADFIDFWAAPMRESGIPAERVYSHIAFLSRSVFEQMNFPISYSQAVHFSPPEVAFGANHRAGFSTYPQTGQLEQLRSVIQEHGNLPWASCEGSPLDPAQAGAGTPARYNTEAYLGHLYNHGAAVVNLFGWGVGEAANPFRRALEAPESVNAYRKFLQGEPLSE